MDLSLGPGGNGISRDEPYGAQGNLLLASFDVATNGYALVDLAINSREVLMEFAYFCDYADVFIATKEGILSGQDEVGAHFVPTVGILEAGDFVVSSEEFFEERVKLVNL